MAITVDRFEENPDRHERTPGIRLSRPMAALAVVAVAAASIFGYRAITGDRDAPVRDPIGLGASDSLSVVPDIQGIEGIDVDGERVGVTNFRVESDPIEVQSFFGAVINYLDGQQMGAASNYLAPPATMNSLDGRLEFAEVPYLGAGDTGDGGSDLFVALDGNVIGTGPFNPDAAVQEIPLGTQGGQSLFVSTNVMPGHTPA